MIEIESLQHGKDTDFWRDGRQQVMIEQQISKHRRQGIEEQIRLGWRMQRVQSIVGEAERAAKK